MVRYKKKKIIMAAGSLESLEILGILGKNNPSWQGNFDS
jgi:hypothetical protein